jgi:hypothetical protein
MFGLFKPSSVSLEDQIQILKGHRISFREGIGINDLLISHDREKYEKKPFELILWALGGEVEKDPYPIVSDDIWDCDYERIEDRGSYSSVISRLHALSGMILPISNIHDHVSLDEEKAWVEFSYEDKIIHWDAEFNDDWLDDKIILKFNGLLQKHDLSIYWADGGQVSLFICKTPNQYIDFQKTSRIKFTKKEYENPEA